MKKILQLQLLCLFISMLFPIVGFAQFDIPPKPDVQTSVYDYAGVLSSADKAGLEQKLIDYYNATSTQIVVVTIPTIKGDDIGLITPKWLQDWGIGQAKEDNGVLVLLARDERKIWISPGYGLEDKLTAGQLGEMIREVIIPEFKAGSYFNGLNKGTDAIIKMIDGKYNTARPQETQRSNSNNGGGVKWFGILIFIVIIVISVISRRGGGRGGNGGGGIGSSILTGMILGSMGRSSGGWGGGGFGGSSGGGGGFGGGFGGGGSSGGGAGGSW